MKDMTIERAIQILTPGSGRYSPVEYEKAMMIARASMRAVIRYCGDIAFDEDGKLYDET